MFSHIPLYKKSEEIVRLLTERYEGKNGLLVKGKNLKSNTIYNSSIVDDLGDYNQYICWFGELWDDKYVEWSLNQIKLMEKYCKQSTGLFQNVNTNKRKEKEAVLQCPAKNIDTLLGLIETYNITKSKKVLKDAEGLASGILEHFTSESGFVYVAGIPKIGLVIPTSNATMCGSYIEEFANLYDITKKKEFLLGAKRVANAWIKTNYFEKNSFFADVHFPKFEPVGNASTTLLEGALFILFKSLSKGSPLFLKTNAVPEKYREYGELVRLEKIDTIPEPFRIKTATMMKNNTQMIFGILALYRKTKNQEWKHHFYTWFNALTERMLRSDGGFNTVWDPRKKQGHEVILTKNSSILEVLIDAFILFNDEDILTVAERNAKYWLNKQNKNNGLFPVNSEVEILNKFDYRSMLDSNTDFIVNLIKLYKITEKKEYFDSISAGLEGIFKHFYFKEGYILYCDYRNGKPIGHRGWFVKTKFNALFLKPLLLLSEIENGKDPIRNQALWSLSRDR